MIKNINKFFNNSQKIIETELKYGCQNYGPLPVILNKGKEHILTDINGKEYIDCLAGYGAINQGHCNPKIGNVMKKQLETLTMTARAFYNDKLGEALKLLTKTFNYEKAILMNTGSDAGETAVKFARRWGYRVKKVEHNKATIVFPLDNFWGRSITACGTSDDESRYKDFGPYCKYFHLVKYGDINALEKLFKSDPNIVGYFFEPIQGEAGIIIPPKNYLNEVRELCNKYNVLMIADEVQCGLGRTGKLLCSDWNKVKPDMVILGKALSGGYYPVSTVLSSNEVMDLIKPGEHGSTYGGNPLAASLIEPSLDVLINDGLVENSRVIGEYLIKKLFNLKKKYDFVEEIRGRGLFIGIEFNEKKIFKTKELLLELMKNGLLSKDTHENTIRITPPLTINKNIANKIFEILDYSINNLINK